MLIECFVAICQIAEGSFRGNAVNTAAMFGLSHNMGRLLSVRLNASRTLSMFEEAGEETPSMSPLADRASLRKAKLIEKLESVSDAEIVAFAGPNAHRFLPAWHDMKDQAEGRKRFALRWCWPAFFFGFAWFLYRRMYALAAALLFIPILLALFTPLGSTGGSSLGIVMAMFAKAIYVGHVQSKIRKIKERAVSAEEASAKIVRAGGVSIAGGVIGGSIWVGLVLLTFAPLFATMTGRS